MPSLTLALHSPAAADPAVVGTKAATLSALVAAGFAVPEGQVLVTAAFDAVRAAAGLGVDATAQQVHAAALPADVDAAISMLAAHFADATLAVRSSAAEEDGPDASYAGQFETVLHVRGEQALRAAVRRCWASGCSDRVRTYRFSGAVPALAVLVQRQVEADVAGVAFTADPVTGDCSAVRVAAAPGLGDAVVSGAVEPDEWLVSESTATPLRVDHQALTDEQAQAVAALARSIEELRGVPQDVEWAMAGGRLVVLQARPVTALPRSPQATVPDGTWVKEVERRPEPLSEFGASLAAPLISRGLTTMSRESGGLIDRFEARAIGGEAYLQVVPLGGRGGPPPPWWVLGILSRVAPPLRRQMRRAERLLAPGVLEATQQRWDQQWRPELQHRIGRLRAIDLTELDDAGLLTHLDESVAVLDHALDVHFRLIPPYIVPVHDLLVECRRLGWSDTQTMDLLAGTSTATSAPSRELGVIADRIRADEQASALVDVSGADLAERLRQDCPPLGVAFDDWCAQYGQCCVNDDPGSPTLAELPTALANMLRVAVRGAGEDTQQRTAETRATRAAEARTALDARPAAQRERFERTLAAALRAYPLREDAAFWTGSQPAGLLRSTAVEFGRRLVNRGALTRAEHVVDLDIDTVRAALAAEPATIRAAAARSRAERAYVRAHPGPAHYGPPPQPLPDLRGLPPAGRRLNEALLAPQRRAVPAASDEHEAAALRGVPASPGRYAGPVRLVCGADDFARLRAGDVLVCPSTDPAWSVLFGVAGALITDGGNVLSHAAIVAREHALPAVVGTGTATRSLHDGQLVTVDGSAGTVTVHPEGNPR